MLYIKYISERFVPLRKTINIHPVKKWFTTICIPESFNTYISPQLFYYKKTFVIPSTKKIRLRFGMPISIDLPLRLEILTRFFNLKYVFIAFVAINKMLKKKYLE